MDKPVISSVIVLGSDKVECRFNIKVDGKEWDVEGKMNIRNLEYSPELIGFMSVEQFATDVAKMDVEEFKAALQDMVDNNINPREEQKTGAIIQDITPSV